MRWLLGSILVLIPLAASAQQVQIRPQIDLSFGEIAVPNPGGGHVELDPQTGMLTTNNAVMLQNPVRGSFEIAGKAQQVSVTIFVDPFICDPTYLPACIGAPTYTPAHSFPGFFTTGCPSPRARCSETHYLGGRFSYDGGEEGRWTTTVTLIVDYQ